MWMLAVLRRWYAISSHGESSRAWFTVKWAPWSVQVYWILRLLRCQLRELLHHTPANPDRVFHQGRLCDFAALKDLHRFCEDGHHFVRSFSTMMRRDGQSEQSLINQEIVRISDQARKASSQGALDREQFFNALDRFQDVLLRHYQELNAVNVVTMLHRMGSMAKDTGCDPSATHHRLLEQLIAAVEDHIPELKPRHVSNVIWALGKIRMQMPPSITAWMNWEPLLHRLVQHGVQGIEKFWPRNVSNILLGLAYLENKSCRPFLPILASQAKASLHEFSPQEMSNTVWGLAKLEYIDQQDFLRKAFKQVEDTIDRFTPQQIAVIMWSMAVFRYPESDALAEQVVEILGKKECHSQALAVVLWSLLQRHICPLRRQIDRLLEDCPGFAHPPYSASQVRDLCMILVVLADFGYRSPRRTRLSLRLRDALHAEPLIFSPQDICNFVWALMIMDSRHLSPALLHLSFDRLSRLGFEKLRDEDIRQFYQCILHLRVFRLRTSDFSVLPASLERRWKTIWSVRQATSPLPLWVASALVVMEDMGYPCQGRFLEQGLINTCIVDLKDDFKYAIEGISFLRSFRNQPSHTTGRYIWKVRLLEAMGYEVLRVEEKEWMQLTQTEQKRRYLQDKITEARANTMTKMKSVQPP